MTLSPIHVEFVDPFKEYGPLLARGHNRRIYNEAAVVNMIGGMKRLGESSYFGSTE